MDPARLTAVDVHVHVEADHDGHMSLPEDFAAAPAAYFGSDYPLVMPDRWLDDFGKLDIKPQVRPTILKDNAVRVLNLGPPPGGVSR